MNLNWIPEKATLTLPLPHPEIPWSVRVRAEQEGLTPKKEIHLTILSFQNGKKLLQAIRDGRISDDDIMRLANSFSWDIGYKSEYATLERTIPEFVLHGSVQTPRHTRRSLIQNVSVPDLAKFFTELSRMSGVLLEDPYSHITLFTWSDYPPEAGSGIALNSQEQFEQYVTSTFSA